MKKLLFIALVALLVDCVLWLVRAAWVAVLMEMHPGVLVMGLAVALFFGLVAGAYFFYPRIVKRPVVWTLGLVHFWGCVLWLIPFYEQLLLIPRPRRYFDYVSSYYYMDEAATAWLLVALAAQVVFLFNLVYSAVKPVERGNGVG